MRRIPILLLLNIIATVAFAQNPVRKWQKISHVSSYEGQTFDSHKALLTQKPCAEKIVWEMNADKTFRLDASSSGCDDSYKKMQEKLYSKTNWRLDGNKLMISTLKDFAVGQTYAISFTGNKMTWVGNNGQGTIIYQRL